MSSRFSYGKFAYQVLVETKEPCSPGGMAREAMMSGAPHTQDKLVKQLRAACESLASRADIKRTRNKEAKGYLYQFVG